MAHLRSLIAKQLSRFLLIQNAVDDALDDDFETLNLHLVNTRLEVLETNWAKFQCEHDNICEEADEDFEESTYIKNKTYERCQEFYVQKRAALLGRQEEIEASNSSARSSNLLATNPQTTNLQAVTFRNPLPKIELPKFSGNYDDWRSFHDLFLSMVGTNVGLPNVQKMHYLRTHLSGEAAKLIINIPVSEEMFPLAWETLVRRYENKRVLISSQLDKLFSIKRIQTKSSRELNTFISTVLESLGALKALGCSTEHWDPVLINQLSRLLDADTREDWEVKLGASTSYPTFKQFEEFLIGQARAWERLEFHDGEKSGKSRSSRSLNHKADSSSRSLVAVTPKSTGEPFCQYCKSKHYLSTCQEFMGLNSQRRRRFIVQHSLCFNCLGSHMVNRCPSTRRCKKCAKKHHTSIHDSFKSATSTPSTSATNNQKVEGSTSNLPSTSDTK